MSSPQVTFLELLQTWKVLADKSHVDCMKVDMKNFFLQCKNEANLPIAEVARRKDQILQIWVDTDWKMAQKNNPGWSNKDWWEKRFRGLDNAFGAILKDAYGMAPVVEQQKPKETFAKKPTSESQVEDMPVFDNPIDFLAWTKKRKQG